MPPCSRDWRIYSLQFPFLRWGQSGPWYFQEVRIANFLLSLPSSPHRHPSFFFECVCSRGGNILYQNFRFPFGCYCMVRLSVGWDGSLWEQPGFHVYSAQSGCPGSLFPTTPGYGYAFAGLLLEPDPSHGGRREVESLLPTSVGLGLWDLRSPLNTAGSIKRDLGDLSLKIWKKKEV